MIDAIGSMDGGLFGLSNQDPLGMQNHKKKRPFQLADLNGNGTLDKTEAMSFVDKISQKSGKDINGEELFSKIDTNQDGLIDRDEFKAGKKHVKDIVGPPPTKPGMGHKGGDFTKMLMDMVDQTDEDTLVNNGIFDSNTLNNTLLNSYTTTASLLNPSSTPFNILA
ncbi:MAG: EF-hand domain-containing protein [bacterium]|nr:EF-hand domain-containing protein [bacterium]